ncbi:MAG: Wzz/FepE/Etk N-terminal domain-containing protein, partial [Candidatus Pacebacteria bacterium]|nr:Wzz/FepE/Etk N-terminal domain-containing protein [Candidatus Paceibacterota bacterium]
MSEFSETPPSYGYGAATQNAGEASFHVNDLWRVIRNRWPTSITILTLVMATGFVVTKLQPKIYESSAVLRVEKENRDLQVFQTSFEAFDPVFFQTEFELIQSKKVLYPVITKLGVASRLCKAMELPE